MWTFNSTELPDGDGIHCTVKLHNRPASFEQVERAWRLEPDFRSLFNAVLAESPFNAFRWETPPVTAATFSRPFEFVLLDCPTLDRTPDPNAFAEQLDIATESVAVFSNLGGDAMLVVPAKISELAAYGNLAAFVRLAPASQQGRLWQAVGDSILRRISTKPVWLSTAGAGVPWLHIRLDDRPKYYHFRPYKIAPG